MRLNLGGIWGAEKESRKTWERLGSPCCCCQLEYELQKLLGKELTRKSRMHLVRGLYARYRLRGYRLWNVVKGIRSGFRKALY